MKKSIFWTIILAFFFGVFETTILSHIRILPVIPDLILLLLLYISFRNGSRVGTITGFFSGLILDFLSVSPFGLHAFLFTLVGFIVGKVQGRYNFEKITTPCMLAILGTLFKALIFFVLSFIFGSNIKAYNLTSIIFWSELGINTLLAPIIFGLINLFPSVFYQNEEFAT